MHTAHGWLSEKQSKPAVCRPEGNTCLQVVTEETKVTVAHCLVQRVRYFKAAFSLKAQKKRKYFRQDNGTYAVQHVKSTRGLL